MSKKVFVLGGTAPHAELIQRLNHEGYETILIDYLDNSAAKPFASRHIQESTLDKETVLRLAQAEKPDYVVALCIDQANVTACYVSEQLGLPHPYSYETALDVTQKGKMKAIFQKGGISTAPYYVLSEADEPSLQLPLPVVIKPTDANSSKGVFKIDTEEEFYQKFPISLACSREGKVIVEEYIDGTEIQVDCIAIGGKAHVLMVKDMIPMDFGKQEMNVCGYLSPGPVCTRFMAEIERTAQQIVDAFGLVETAFFFQAKCNDKGLFVLEFAARCAGGSAFAVVGLRSGMDYLDLTWKAFIQEPISLDLHVSPKILTGYFLRMKPGRFDRVDGVEQQISEGNLHYYYPSAISGMEVDERLQSGARIGVALTMSDTYPEGMDKMQKALDAIQVLDSDGRDLSYWKDSNEMFAKVQMAQQINDALYEIDNGAEPQEWGSFFAEMKEKYGK